MSEVQRYYVGKYGLVEGEALGRIGVVLGADHDRVTAERDALQQRLTAADERADELERDAARYRWLRDPDNRDDLEPEDILVVGIAEGEDIVWLEQMDQAIDANLESLNPAGGGGHD